MTEENYMYGKYIAHDLQTDEKMVFSSPEDLDAFLDSFFEDFESYAEGVLEWANEKGIFASSNSLKQLEKTYEELSEVIDEINRIPQDNEKILLEFGDVLVTLVIAMQFHNIDAATALGAALTKIMSRTGKMVDGKFVKDGD